MRFGNVLFVIGEDECDLNQASIALLSYVWPSAAMTGSAIGSCVIGHKRHSEMGSASRGRLEVEPRV